MPRKVSMRQKMCSSISHMETHGPRVLHICTRQRIYMPKNLRLRRYNIQEMKRTLQTRFVDPYKVNKSGRLVSNIGVLNPALKQSGVYLIKSKRSGKIVYVGYSTSQLYRTLYRHFQQWKDISRTVQTRFTYSKTGYTVRVIFTTPARAASLEKYLIMKLQPRDNSLKYEMYLTAAQQTTCAEILSTAGSIGANDDYPF
jgi:hypothetical protein